MNQNFYYNLVSGHSKGWIAAVLRAVLSILATIYSLIIRLRNLLYNQRVFKIHHNETPVISIGNITLGGTGKTPLVIWLCNYLHKQNLSCAILTRGYKTQTKTKTSNNTTINTITDEPAVLSENCRHVEVIVDPDRVAGAAKAIEEFGAKVLIMDDGFQHRRLARDLDIVTIDATQPFGYGKIFPAGLLREPPTSLGRADAVVITRCDQISEPELGKIKNKLLTINPKLLIAQSIHAAANIISTDNSETSVEQLNGSKIFAFCGIGNPNSFITTIEALGAEITGSKIYNDHHQYTQSNLVDIYTQAGLAGAEFILTTQKDWTKIKPLKPDIEDIRLAYMVVEIKFIAGRDKLTCLIKDTLAGKISTINQ
jgi:tetraacyldisaccharide 4'-kinase